MIADANKFKCWFQKCDFSHEGNTTISDESKVGFGRAMEDKSKDDESQERRKRGVFLKSISDDVIKSTKIGRGKRQVAMPQNPTGKPGASGIETIIEQAKAIAKRVMEMVQQMRQGVSQMRSQGGGQGGRQGGSNAFPQNSNAETFQ